MNVPPPPHSCVIRRHNRTRTQTNKYTNEARVGGPLDCSHEGWETAEGESVHTKRKCRASNDRVDSRLCGSRSVRILLAVGVALYLPEQVPDCT